MAPTPTLPGPWNVRNVLDAAYSEAASESPYNAYTLNIEVQDKPGVLNQVGVLLLWWWQCVVVCVGV